MTQHCSFLAALSVFALAGSVSAQTALSPVPSNPEVVAYVTTNWSSYDSRFAFLSGRRGESPDLISVTEVECEADGRNARCAFVVHGRFRDGVILHRPMEGLFQRQADGSIEMLIPVAVG